MVKTKNIKINTELTNIWGQLGYRQRKHVLTPTQGRGLSESGI